MVTPVRISILLCRPRSWTSANTRSPMRGGAYIGVTLAISSRGTARVVRLYFMFGLSISCIEPFLPREPDDDPCVNRSSPTGFLLECGTKPQDRRKAEIRCHHELLRACFSGALDSSSSA